jgi:manganese/zinc/iron transport system permease protein
MATVSGLLFGGAFLFAPERGIVAQVVRRARQRVEFAQTMLAIHLLHHEGSPAQAEESRVDHLSRELRWQPSFAQQVVTGAERSGLVDRRNGTLALTERGRDTARKAMVQ